MRNVTRGILVAILVLGLAGCAELKQMAVDIQSSEPDTTRDSENRIVAGLKEALTVGADHAVAKLSQAEAYFSNPALKIPLPERIRQAGEILRTIGMGSVVDEFEHSMNSAAEKAAPKAKTLFLDAIRDMTFEDVRQILQGPDTAATDYLRSKTQEKLTSAFRPIIHDTMNDVGVTRLYQQMVDAISGVPFAPAIAVDLDTYVTGKALDGLFFMLAEEEKKIRTDPAARVTELLRDVFGGRQ